MQVIEMTKKSLIDNVDSYIKLKSEMLECAKNICSDDKAIEIAIYWLTTDYYSGINSDDYKIRCTSEYKPGKLISGIKDEGKLEQKVYKLLEKKFSKRI